MSEAPAEKSAVAPPGPVASTVIEAGTVMAGAVVSSTVTVNEPVEVLPAESVAEQSTVVTPSANVELDAGTQSTETEPSTRSLAVAVNVASAPPGPVASTGCCSWPC